MQQNNRFHTAPQTALNTTNFHPSRSYQQQHSQHPQQQSPQNGGIVIDSQAQINVNGEASPINAGVSAATVSVAALEFGATDELQQSQQQPQQAPSYANMNGQAAYPAAPSPSLYSGGPAAQYMVEAGVQNLIGELDSPRFGRHPSESANNLLTFCFSFICSKQVHTVSTRLLLTTNTHPQLRLSNNKLQKPESMLMNNQNFLNF